MTTSSSNVTEPVPASRLEVHSEVREHKPPVDISLISYLENPKQVRVKKTNCRCPRRMMAVCGANNETYFNECLADCDEAEVQCQGRCPCPERLIDPRLVEPIPKPTMDPEVKDLWRRLMNYITSMWGTPRSGTVTGTVKML